GPSSALLSGLGAGVAIAAFYVCLQRTTMAAGLWPLVAARGVSATALVGYWLAMPGRLRPTLPAGPILRLVFAAGAIDILANALYVIAVRQGQLGIVATLASLYPASTIMLAHFLIGEPVRPAQAAHL